MTSWANANTKVKLHSQVHIELGLQVLTRPVLTWPVRNWPDLILYTYPLSYPSTPQLLPGKYRKTSLAVQGALSRLGFLLLSLLWQGGNKVNSYSDQLKLGQVCKFGVEFDNYKAMIIVLGMVTLTGSLSELWSWELRIFSSLRILSKPNPNSTQLKATLLN